MKNFVIGLSLLILAITGCWYVGKYCIETVTVKGIVISHHTTSDRIGTIEYYTVAKFEDGQIRSMRGLSYFVEPVGGTVYYSYNKLK